MQKEENRESHIRSQRGIAATKENKSHAKTQRRKKKRDTKSLRNLSVCHASITRFAPDWAGKKIRVPRTATDQNKGCLPKEAKNFKQKEGKTMAR